MYQTPDQLKRENERLQRELEDQRYEDEQRRSREAREREDRRRQQAEERREAMHTANDWPDALYKGRILAQREASLEAHDNATLAGQEGFAPSTFFQDWVRELDRADVIYVEEMAWVEKRIAEMRQAALNRIADRLHEEFPDSRGGTEQALRDNDPSALVNW